ncbi:MAG TPA: LCP family protein [Clostridia bacterium]|nr:LCP family protein [Clostridia bacterium]
MEPRQKDKNKKRARRKTFKLFALILLCAALVVGVNYAYVLFQNPMRAFEKPPAKTPLSRETPNIKPKKPLLPKLAPTPEPTPEPTPDPDEELRLQADADFMKNKVNILLLGYDQSPEREDKKSPLYRDKRNNYRSDVLMLLCVDFEKNAAHMISIPRDTYAPIYNKKGRWKINSAFAHGGSAKGEGFLYAMKTVSNLLGVPVEYYAGVDMSGLKAIVDAMGGVDYEVDVRIKLNGRVLEKGFQHLNGQEALDYMRGRKGISTDVGRVDRQQRLLFAIFSQLKQKNQLVNLPKIYLSVADKLKTNLTLEQIAALAVFGMGLELEDISRHTLSGEYISDVYNASFYVLHNSKLKALIKKIYGITIKPNPRYDASYVRADKAAAEALSYAEGAEHLIDIAVEGEDVRELRAALESVLEVAQRSIPVDASEQTIEKLTASQLDRHSILRAKLKLAEAMYRLCLSRGITKQAVKKSLLPPSFYKALPDSNAP